MLARISNIAHYEDIELTLDATFDYHSLHAPRVVINGLKETSVPLITADAPKRIKFGIWGILPEFYKNGWEMFQSENHSLETKLETLQPDSWLDDALNNRRCLIIATGYFTSIIKNKLQFPFHLKLRNQPIFCFAGAYNVLEDGFITFTILSHTAPVTPDVMETPKPIILKKSQYAQFLGQGFSFEKLINKDYEIETSEIMSYQISKEIYKNKNHTLDELNPKINPTFYN